MQNIQLYASLTHPLQYIRLVILCPGIGDEQVRLKTTQIFLKASEELVAPERKDQIYNEMRKNLPQGWDVCETLEGGAIYVHTDPEGNTSSSWQPPNIHFPQINHWAEEIKTTEVLAQDGCYEVLSNNWGLENNSNNWALGNNPQKAQEMVPVHLERPNLAAQSAYDTVSIAKNIVDSLRLFRDDKNNEKMFWIDTMCINHQYTTEKNFQIRRMGDIFKAARRVVVRLGCSGEDSQIAMRTLEHIGKQSVTTANLRGVPAPDAEEKLWYKNRSRRFRIDDKVFNAISNLLQRPQFKSLWMLQEVHLAHECLFFCGEDQIEWKTFRSAILTLSSNRAFFNRIPMEIEMICSMAELQPSKHPISEVLYQVCPRICQDPRDKIYGIHGLFPKGFQHFTLPVYDPYVSTDDVFNTATTAHIKYTQRLEILRFCHRSQSEALSRQSWCMNLLSERIRSREMDWQFAAGYSRCAVDFDRLPILMAAGIQCGVVTRVRQPLPTGIPLHEALKLAREWEPENMDSGTYVGGRNIRDAYARTLTRNSLQDRFPARKNAGNFSEWIAQTSPTALFGVYKTHPILPDAQYFPNQNEALALENLSELAWVETSSGYFGQAPRDALQGDVIVVFLGCESPILLRPLMDGTWQVIGECFVFGLNDASAFLGPLPPHIVAQVFKDSSGLFTDLRFYNCATGIFIDDDPRLPRLPGHWEILQRGPRTSEDPRLYKCFRNKETGAVVNSDPRMEHEELTKRGVGLGSFQLV